MVNLLIYTPQVYPGGKPPYIHLRYTLVGGPPPHTLRYTLVYMPPYQPVYGSITALLTVMRGVPQRGGSREPP